MDHPIILVADNFDSEVTQTPGVILVDYWASWCAPCQRIAPLLERLALDLSGRARVGKVDVDAEGVLASRYGVMRIPTLIIFKDGLEAERLEGLHPYEALLALVETHL